MAMVSRRPHGHAEAFLANRADRGVAMAPKNMPPASARPASPDGKGFIVGEEGDVRQSRTCGMYFESVGTYFRIPGSSIRVAERYFRIAGSSFEVAEAYFRVPGTSFHLPGTYFCRARTYF